ncbi:acyl-CoA dehydrogenase family protein [Sandarakinorhabdus sp.]|uniref:acyl-CoA dehydrogenase family protein n=1 Tax=Sandarakinorhabdus sp. TaxID=1916663 RepID=UPI00286E00B9|nr:acyl-CoA dehydrogenase family protein [Sandarakinorhabdus sp.]
MTDFTLSPETQALARRVRQFVIDKIVPFERDPRLTQHGPSDSLRDELVALARAEGLLTPQAPVDLGGMGFDHATQAAVFEAAGWSTLGPVAMNCAAPDEGNMYILGRIARPDQIAQFLAPMVLGHRRSVFAMTEPGGAGSDPSQLSTTAVFNGNDYEINGLKWLITGANGAKTWIIMANVPENPHGAHGPTLFLCEGDTPGIQIERVMDSMDRNYVEGHAVVRFAGLRLGPTQVLGEVGSALRYAQMRLAPARLTHCMRWLGAAARCQDIAIAHARTRTAFGKALIEHQGVNFMIADNEIAMHQARLAIRHVAWLLDNDVRCRHESSIVKASISEDLFKVADRCVQILGGIGVTSETVVEMIFRDMRGFRLYDGPTEVHKYAIAVQIMRQGSAFADPVGW